MKYLSLVTLIAFIGCTEEISQKVQNSSSSDNDVVSEAAKFQNKAIRLVSKMDEDLSFIMHKEGSEDTACELASPSLGFSATDYTKSSDTYTMDCIMDANELDLYREGAQFEVQVDEFLCEYISYTPYRFFQYQPGTTNVVQYQIACDEICQAAQPTICNSLAENKYKVYDPVNALDTQYKLSEAEGFDTLTVSNADAADTDFTVFREMVSETNTALSCGFDYTTSGGPNCDEGKITTKNIIVTGNSADIDLGQRCTMGNVLVDFEENYRDTAVTCEETLTWNTGFCINAGAPATRTFSADNDPDDCAQSDGIWFNNNGVGIDDGTAPAAGTRCLTNGTLVTTITDPDDCDRTANHYWVGDCSNANYGSAETCIAANFIWNGPSCVPVPDDDPTNSPFGADNTYTFKDACPATHSFTTGTCNNLENVAGDFSAHTSQALCEAVGTWEYQATCLDTVGASDISLVTGDDSQSSCGGKHEACLAGPDGTITDKEKFSATIYENTNTEEFSQDFTVASPFSLGLNSNMYVANFSRICADTSTDKSSNAVFDSTLFTITGHEIEDLPPYASYTGTSYDSDGIISNVNGAADYTAYALHPFHGVGYFSRPKLNTLPYYSVKCLDQAKDVKAQIRLFIREWDREFTDTNAYLGRISDINQSTPLMDSSGDQDSDEQNPWNDYQDWDDFYTSPEDDVFLNGVCGTPGNGKCYRIEDLDDGTCYTANYAADDGHATKALCLADDTTNIWVPDNRYEDLNIDDKDSCDAADDPTGAGETVYITNKSSFPAASL